MGDTIKTRKGSKAALDADPLLLAELGFVTDEERVYIGGNTGNIPLPNAADLSERVKQTTKDITYYVSTTGNDSNDGLTSGTTFKTIAKAISMLPQVINHTVNINIASGTYNETVNINGFFGQGSINVNGGTTNVNAVNYIVNQLLIKNCTCNVTIKGVTANTTSSFGFGLYNNVYVSLVSCVCTASTAVQPGIHGAKGGTVCIATCIISNRANGIQALNGTIIISDSNSGTGNATGIFAASGGTITKAGTQPTGTTAESTSYGGAIR